MGSREVNDVYAIEVLDSMTRLYDRRYEVIEEVKHTDPGTPLIFGGACVCSSWKDWKERNSMAYWFCEDKKTGKRATATIHESGQVEVKTPGCSDR